jgi:hypothetical protein
MNSLTRRSSFLSALALVIIGLTTQANAQSGEDVSYIAVVKGTDVYVRCGAAESYYPFAKVNAGDMVKVSGEKFDWARVSMTGPAFRFANGYIKYAKGDASRFRIATDGKSGVTLGKTDIVAPNLESKDLKTNYKDSWKAIARLEANQTLQIIETIETDKDTIHKVALPEAAQGWISKAYLEQASESQVAQWTASLTQRPEDKTATAQAKAVPQLPTRSNDQGVKPIPANQSPQHPTMTNPVMSESDMQDAEQVSLSQPAEDQIAVVTATTKPTEPKQPTLESLEAAFKELQKESIETAEVAPLRQLYVELGTRNPNDTRVQRYVKGRAEQLLVWSDLQKRRMELSAFRNKTKLTAAETEAVHKALESSAAYIAVGRIAASTIYDGERLPKLLRIQEAANGRTIAYLKPDSKYEVVNLIGNLVGIVGEKTYDEVLHLNIIQPKKIDLLTPEQFNAAVKTEH